MGIHCCMWVSLCDWLKRSRHNLGVGFGFGGLFMLSNHIISTTHNKSFSFDIHTSYLTTRKDKAILLQSQSFSNEWHQTRSKQGFKVWDLLYLQDECTGMRLATWKTTPLVVLFVHTCAFYALHTFNADGKNSFLKIKTNKISFCFHKLRHLAVPRAVC